ncbi:hypothetical protein CCB80_05290 [Armatimonadetes bacterium Uphvl-Ar1]|nr:hypothetical protein CCB80_05290 [Armatimonadetes bacterium Uphvl-Ar1]
MLDTAMGFLSLWADGKRESLGNDGDARQSTHDHSLSVVNLCDVLIESLRDGIMIRNAKEAEVFEAALVDLRGAIRSDSPSPKQVAELREKVAYLSREYGLWQKSAVSDMFRELSLGCSELIQAAQEDAQRLQSVRSELEKLVDRSSYAPIGGDELRALLAQLPTQSERWDASKDFVKRRVKLSEKLTGRFLGVALGTHEEWCDEVVKCIGLVGRGAGQYAAALVDIDQFLEFIDREGSVRADEVLERVGSVLKDCVGASGFVARANGDEFYICAAMRADEFVTRLTSGVAQISESGVTVSVGCVPISPRLTRDEVSGYLAIGVQRAKSTGGNQIFVLNTEREAAA